MLQPWENNLENKSPDITEVKRTAGVNTKAVVRVALQ
jgi:hypothetical protein